MENAGNSGSLRLKVTVDADNLIRIPTNLVGTISVEEPEG